jgi:hypothetical protein
MARYSRDVMDAAHGLVPKGCNLSCRYIASIALETIPDIMASLSPNR